MPSTYKSEVVKEEEDKQNAIQPHTIGGWLDMMSMTKTKMRRPDICGWTHQVKNRRPTPKVDCKVYLFHTHTEARPVCCACARVWERERGSTEITIVTVLIAFNATIKRAFSFKDKSNSCRSFNFSRAWESWYLAWIFKHGFSVWVKFLWQCGRIKPYILPANNLRTKRQSANVNIFSILINDTTGHKHLQTSVVARPSSCFWPS